MFYVYIAKSLKDNRYYIGSTNNVERRIDEHNAGKTKSLINRRPLKIVYTEECDNLSLARKRELKIKSYKGGEAFKKLISGGFA